MAITGLVRPPGPAEREIGIRGRVSPANGDAPRPGETATAYRPAYAVYVLLLLLAASTLSNADRHVFSVLLPAIREEFQLTNAAIGLIAGPGFIIPYVLLTMPLARLADRWSARPVLAGAVAFWSIASAFCGLASTAWQLALGRIAVGAGEAGGGPPAQSLVAMLFTRRRNVAMGMLSAGVYLGILVGLTGGAAIAVIWGWRVAFLALAAPGLPLALLIWLTAPRQGTPGKSPEADTSLSSVLRRCLATRSLLLLSLGMGIFTIFGYAGAIWMPSYFVQSHGMSMIEAGTWLGLGSAMGGVLGSFAGGAIVDALVPRDQRWQLRVPAAGLLLAFPLLAATFLLPGGSGVMILGHQVPLVALLSVVTSFLSSLWAGPSYAAVARLVRPGDRAQAIGLLVIVLNVTGSLFGPPVAGIVSDILTPRFGVEALRYSLLAMSMLVVIGGLVYWRAAAHYRSEIIA